MKKIKIIVFVLATVLLTACVYEPRTDTIKLYDRFIEYKQKGYGNNNESRYFTDSLWKAIQKSRESTIEKQGLSAILLNFPNGLKKISEHKETIHGDDGCLMIMGITDDKTPADYFISFKHEQGRWLFNEISMRLYLDGTGRFLHKVVCDEEQQTQLWLEYMQSQESGKK